MSDRTALERVLGRDRAITLVALAGITASAWLYLLGGAGMEMGAASVAEMMTGMAPMAWTPGYFGLMLAMWTVMMTAMMLPSAAPTILVYGSIARRRRPASPHRATALFAAGYLLVWIGFSLGATLLQWRLEHVALLSPAMASTSALFGGAVLLAAGLYQLSPLKDACLRHCRSPLDFVARHWRKGPAGALRMGAEHGLYCLGCCWVLMGLLFVGGVMNLLWIALITLLVLTEKMAPQGPWIGRIVGGGLVLWGGWTLSAALT